MTKVTFIIFGFDSTHFFRSELREHLHTSL
jgi:hypothetical protein